MTRFLNYISSYSFALEKCESEHFRKFSEIHLHWSYLFINLLNAKLLWSNFSAHIFIYKYFYHQFHTAESKHFHIMGSVLQLPSQFRKDCQSKQQLLRGDIFKILGKGGGNLFCGAFAFQEGITLINHGFFHLKKFWMLQVKKSHFCGISAIFFQCYFMSET